MKKSLLLMLFLALTWCWTAQAQELTVCDGTNNSEKVPFDGWNADGAQHNQMIFPATDLAAMNGMAISKMVFYVDGSASNGIYNTADRLGTWTVSLGETTATTLSGLDNTTVLTQVYQGYFNCSTGTLTLLFENEYVYNGGNLLVDLDHAAASYNRWYFLGENQTSNTAFTKGSAYQFLPKTTFTYAAPPSCFKPSALVAQLTEGNGSIATLSWTAGGSETAWVLEYGTASDFAGATSVNVSGNPSKDLTGLTPETVYYARVKADCGGGDKSDWSSAVEFTPSNAYSLTINEGTATNSYVPFYGFYADMGAHSQFIIPASSLSGLQWASLETMTFYSSSASVSWGDAVYDVCLKEVENTIFATPALESWDGMSVVYHGSLSVSGNLMVINFTTPFTYKGGNLMIGFNETTTGDDISLSWLGLSQEDYTAVYKYGSSSSGRAQFLPKLTIDYVPGVAPSCLPPTTLAASSVTSSSAVLNWTAGGTESAWKLFYKKSTESDYTEVNNVTNPYSLSGLASGSVYQFYVKAVCGGSEESEESLITSFTTECEALTIDADHSFMENFDSYTAAPGFLPICWNRINTCSYSSYGVSNYPRIYANSSYSTYANSAPNCLYLYSSAYYSSYDPQPQYAILPEMNDLDGKQLVLYARGYNASSSIIIGRMSDPADVSTFSQIAEQTLTATYAEYEFNLAGVDGDYIAIKIDAASSDRAYNGAYIDDIVVREAPSCLKPTELAVNSISTNSADLSWTANSSESEWKLFYKKAGDENFTEVDNVTDNPYTLEGLKAASQYQFYVQAVCGASDESEASDIAKFVTACDAISAPWSENFDSYSGASYASAPDGYPDDELPICWQFLNRSANTSEYPQVFISSNSGYPVSGNCLFFKSSSATPLYAILPEFADDIAGLQLTFTYRNEGTSDSNGTLYVGYMTNPSDANTFTPVLECPRTTTLTEEEVLFASAPAGSFIAFKYQGGTSNNYYLSIDNVSVKLAPSCLKPTALMLETPSSRTAHTATLKWTNGEEGQTAWQICLNGDETNLVEANSNPFTVTGLTAETAYTAKVRANCGDSQSDWSNETNFTTLIACPAPVFKADSVKNITAHSADIHWGGDAESYIVSYRTAAYVDGVEEGFEDESTYSSWTFSDLVSGSGVSTSAAHSGSYGFCFKWSTSPQYLISPAITGLAAGASLEFYYKNVSDTWAETFQVGYSTTDNAIASFTFGDEITASDVQWHLFSEVVPAGTMYFCIKYTSDDKYYLYVDDISLGEAVAAGEWVIDNNVTANNKQLTGLEAETNYDVKVQCNCGDLDGVSAESDIIQFTTFSDCQRPDALEESEVTANSAKISWNTYEKTAFNIRYKESGAADWIIENSVAMPKTISNLSANTNYIVQVQQTCAEEGEGWSEELSFTTNCVDQQVLPYVESFEGNGFNCFDVANLQSKSSSYIPSVTTTSAISGTHSLKLNAYVYSSYSPSYSTNADSAYAILPAMDFGAEGIAGHRIQFFAKSGGSTSSYNQHIYVGVVGDPIDSLSDFTLVQDVEVTTDFEQYEVSFADYKEIGSRIVLLATVPAGTASYRYGSFYVDSIVVSALPTCAHPTALTVSEITSNSAKLTWTAGGSEGKWQYAYVEAGAAVPTEFEDASNPTVELTGLTANTSYDFYVRAYCSATDQSEVAMLNFRTECAAVSTLPWNEDFEEMDADIVPLCWDNSASSSSTIDSYPERIWGVYSYGENKMIRMYNYFVQSGSALINSPVIDLPSSSIYVLDFDYAHNASCGAFKVKISEDNGESFSDLKSYTKGSGSSYTDPGTFTHAKINLAAYAGKSIILQFYADANYGNGAIFIDNVEVKALAPYSVAINASRYATFYSDEAAYVMPVGLTGHAYTVDALGKGHLSDALYSNPDVVPAGTPLVLEGDAGTYSLAPTLDAGSELTEDNELEGVSEVTVITDETGYTNFVLSLAAGNIPGETGCNYETVGFYWVGTAGVELQPNRAYLKVDNSKLSTNGAPAAFFLIDDENNATWLNNLKGVNSTLKFWHEGHMYILREGIIYDATGKKVREVK